MSGIRAVLFDIGGVLTTSPVVAIREYALSRGIDYGVLGPLIAGPDSAWSRWERSDLDVNAFEAEFEAEARDAGIEVKAREIMAAAFEGRGPRPEMIAVVEHLRGRVALGCITNNVIREDDASAGATGTGSDRPGFDVNSLFEVVVESSRVGMRKPDPRIYQLACEQLGVTPPEAAFLDDIGVNLKGARALGMTTIKVDHTTSAIDELEEALGFPLPR